MNICFFFSLATLGNHGHLVLLQSGLLVAGCGLGVSFLTLFCVF